MIKIGGELVSVITENDVKKLFAQGKIQEKVNFYIEKDMIITPSAKTYLTDKNITIHYKNNAEDESILIKSEKGFTENIQNNFNEENKEVYDTIFGAKLTEKPEIMTHLRGNLLVFKDHPRIAFRGAIDSLESEIILVQLLTQKENISKLTEDLEDIIKFIRHLVRCEVSGEDVGKYKLQELSEAELREHSHHPSRYYGMKHFLPSYKQGEIVAGLNKLRTKSRELEITAYKAFKDEYGHVSREDIILCLNRLSSLFWIMMFKYLTDKYK